MCSLENATNGKERDMEYLISLIFLLGALIILIHRLWLWLNNELLSAIKIGSFLQFSTCTILRGVAILQAQVSTTKTTLVILYASSESFLKDSEFDVKTSVIETGAGFTSMTFDTSMSAPEIVELSGDDTSGRITILDNKMHVEVGSLAFVTV